MECTFRQWGISKLVWFQLIFIYLLYLGCLPEDEGGTVVTHDLVYFSSYAQSYGGSISLRIVISQSAIWPVAFDEDATMGSSQDDRSLARCDVWILSVRNWSSLPGCSSLLRAQNCFLWRNNWFLLWSLTPYLSLNGSNGLTPRSRFV